MHLKKQIRWMMVLGILGSGSLAGATTDPAPKDYIWGKALSLPEATRQITFKPKEQKANFTFFDGVANVRVEAGVLKFTLVTNKAVLGGGTIWANSCRRKWSRRRLSGPGCF